MFSFFALQGWIRIINWCQIMRIIEIFQVSNFSDLHESHSQRLCIPTALGQRILCPCIKLWLSSTSTYARKTDYSAMLLKSATNLSFFTSSVLCEAQAGNRTHRHVIIAHSPPSSFRLAYFNIISFGKVSLFAPVKSWIFVQKKISFQSLPKFFYNFKIRCLVRHGKEILLTE